MPLRFVLDQNFPIQATGLPWPPSLEVIPLRTLAPDLTRDHEDWEIFRALDRRGDVQGFVTNDANLLHLPREMVMLSRTQLTLVVTDGLGHDPLGATGLLMVHLPEIARQNHPTPRTYVLKRPSLQLRKVRETVNNLAAREGITGSALMTREITEIERVP